MLHKGHTVIHRRPCSLLRSRTWQSMEKLLPSWPYRKPFTSYSRCSKNGSVELADALPCDHVGTKHQPTNWLELMRVTEVHLDVFCWYKAIEEDGRPGQNCWKAVAATLNMIEKLEEVVKAWKSCDLEVFYMRRRRRRSIYRNKVEELVSFWLMSKLGEVDFGFGWRKSKQLGRHKFRWHWMCGSMSQPRQCKSLSHA